MSANSIQDLHGSINVVALAGAAVTANGNSTGVDLQGYVGRASVLLTTNNTGGTTPTLAVKLQDSDDNSTFADVASGAFTGLTTVVGTLERIPLNLRAVRRYLRLNYVVSGTTPAYAVAATLIASKQVMP